MDLDLPLEMKSLEELALVPSDVASITSKAIAGVIEEVPRHKTVFAQFFKVNRDLVGPGKPRSITFPKRGTGIVVHTNVSPNSTIGASSFAYSDVTITVQKMGVRLEFTTEAIEQAYVDVIKDQITEAGRVFAESLDILARQEMLDLTRATLTESDVSDDGLTLTTTLVPIIRIVSSTFNTGGISTIDYYSGKFKLTSSISSCTVVFEYSERCKSTGLYRECASPKTLTAKDILLAKAQMRNATFEPDVVLLNFDDLANLLYDSSVKFLEASAYGGREPLLNAELGKIFGMKVVVSQFVPSGVAILVDSQHLGYDVRKRELKFTREDRPDYDAVWYHGWTERNFGVVNDEAVCVVVNAGSDAGDL